MADDNEELVITIDDEPKSAEQPVADATTAAQDELKAQYEQELQKRTAAQAELDAARRRESEAHARAQQAERDAAGARSEATDTQLSAVTTALNGAEAEASAAEQDLQIALEKADYAAAAKAQRRIAQAESKLTQLNQAKEFFETQRHQIQQRPPHPQRPADPVEAFIQTRTQPTADWLRAHRDWVSDPAKSQRLTQAHYHAMGEGLTVDTPEYFAHVEQRLGLREAPVAEPSPKAAAPARKPAPPVAPVNGGSGSSSGRASTEVRLTKGEAQSATDGTHVWNYDDPSPQKRFRKGDPIGVEEFARRKRALQDRGAYDPMNFMATT